MAKQSEQRLITELAFCLELWQKNGGCTFGGCTLCDQCAVPYLLLKLINGKIFHGDMKRLTIDDWQKILEELQNQQGNQ